MRRIYHESPQLLVTRIGEDSKGRPCVEITTQWDGQRLLLYENETLLLEFDIDEIIRQHDRQTS